jgi:hypothetical protein
MPTLDRLAAWIVLLAATSLAQSPSSHPPAGEIVRKSLAWVQWHEKQNFHRQWTLDHTNTTRALDDADQVEKTEVREYKIYPLAGEAYYELIRRDGNPLTANDHRKERKRRQDFLAEVKKTADGKASQDDDGVYVKFNEELITRYNAEVIGTERRGMRNAYVIRFQPKPGKLPVKRRIDYALNKLRGKLWIDQREFAVLRAEFDLTEPVSVWAGLLGSVSQLQGAMNLIEIGEGAWHFKDLDLRLKGRVLFKSLHQERRLEWSHFQKINAAR